MGSSGTIVSSASPPSSALLLPTRSIAFIFITNANMTTVEAGIALAVYIAVGVAWNFVSFLLKFNFLEKLSEEE